MFAYIQKCLDFFDKISVRIHLDGALSLSGTLTSSFIIELDWPIASKALYMSAPALVRPSPVRPSVGLSPSQLLGWSHVLFGLQTIHCL